jgi:hypothetical protein
MKQFYTMYEKICVIIKTYEQIGKCIFTVTQTKQ